jgi:hypothetical protein
MAVTTVGPTYTDQQLVSALMMAGFTNNTIIANLVQIAGWESGKTSVINSNASESPPGFSGCESVGPWQINYCPDRDKGTIREQVANNPNDLTLAARAAYQISNGGADLNQWSTWKQHNSGNVPVGIGLPNPSAFVTTPILGHTTNDPASLAGAGITITSNDPCGARPTGATLSIFPWIVCKLQEDTIRGAEIVIGFILIIVGLIILAKVAGDKSGITDIAKTAAIA